MDSLDNIKSQEQVIKEAKLNYKLQQEVAQAKLIQTSVLQELCEDLKFPHTNGIVCGSN